MSFATGGTVTAVDVALGQQVNAGQVLATLDPGPAQAALTAAQDNLTAAQDNLALAQGGGETPPQQAEDAATITERRPADHHRPERPDHRPAAAGHRPGHLRGRSDDGCARPTAPRPLVYRLDGTAAPPARRPPATTASRPRAHGVDGPARQHGLLVGSTGCAAVTGDQQAVTQDQNA